jgi:anti-sigma factor RsiW
MGGVLGWAGEHERVEALLSTYLDGRATSDERALVERHLAACADCTRNLATLRATVAAVRDMPRVHAPRSFALPRSLARPSQTAPWLYPLLRAATAVAAFLFVLTVAGDLFLRSSPTAPAPMAVPAALAPTSIVMQSEASSAPLATAPTAASEPQKSAPPAAPAPQATQPKLELAAPGSVTPGISAAAKVAPPMPVEPPVEQPLTGGEMGGGIAPGTAPIAPQPTPASMLRESAPTPTATAPIASPSPPPTSIARVSAPQPSADQRQDNIQTARTVVNPLRIAGDVLAALVLILGGATWIVHKRSR